MKRRPATPSIALAVLATGLLLAGGRAAGAPDPTPTPATPPAAAAPAPAKAAASADTKCADCHGDELEGDGKKYEVGAGQRAIDIAGLTNGRRYVFTVYAVNAKGAGTRRAANPIVPASHGPDPPAAVTAKENPNGTVTVSWPP